MKHSNYSTRKGTLLAIIFETWGVLLRAYDGLILKTGQTNLRHIAAEHQFAVAPNDGGLLKCSRAKVQRADKD